MKTKKSQMAIFMILGITIVMLIGLAMYGASNADSGHLSTKQKQMEELFIGKGKYTTYIQSCLDQATKNALYLVGQQGGAIYSDSNFDDATPIPGGTKAIDYHETDDGLRIYYGLTAPPIPTKTENKMLKYPFTNTLPSEPFLSPDSSVYGDSTPFFENFPNPLISLCDYHGPNSLDGENIECGTGPYRYDSTLLTDHNSVQEYLQYYITQKTDECIKLEALPELQGFDIEKENIDVKVTMAASTITSKLSMNLSITDNQTLPKIEISDITIEKNVRLLEMFQILQDIILEDSRNIFYDIKGTDVCGVSSQGPCLKANMVIEKEQVSQGDDWIIKITDTESLLDGKEFTYQVVFENRYPALDYITLDNVKLKSQLQDYDAVAVQGMTLILDPYGYDPDEDFHVAEGYMGEGYTYEFVGGYTEYSPGVNSACLSGNANLNVLVSKLNSNSCRKPSSPPFTTGKKVEWVLGKKDAGEHIINVKICDMLNQCDEQELKILVVPLLVFDGVPQPGIMPSKYLYNSHKLAGSFIYETDPGDTITLGINNAIPVSYVPTSGPIVLNNPSPVTDLLEYADQQYQIKQQLGDVDGKSFTTIITNPDTGVIIYYDENGQPIAYSIDDDEPILFPPVTEQTDEEISYYNLAEALKPGVNVYQQQEAIELIEEEEQETTQPLQDKPLVVVVDGNVNHGEHEIYFIENNNPEYPQIYLVTPNYDDINLQNKVPMDDPIRKMIGDDDGKADALPVKIAIFGTGSGCKNNICIYHFNNNECSQHGSYYKNYCLKSNGCYYGFSININEEGDGHSIEPASMKEDSCSECTSNGCMN